MTSRPNRGGRIAPDGRQSQAPGVGKNSKRHDLERPKTPGLHDSDLQQGDVQALEQGQRIAPLRTQRAAIGGPRRAMPGPAPQGGPQSDVPDPIEFLGERIGGRLNPGVAPRPGLDIRPYMALARSLATAPGASGLLAQAYISQLANMQRSVPTAETPLLDMQDFDERLQMFLDRED